MIPTIKERILTARVYDVAQETPLEYAPNLSARLNNKLLLKREDMQSVFSFKLRGAYNKMAQLPPDMLAQGAIAAKVLQIKFKLNTRCFIILLDSFCFILLLIFCFSYNRFWSPESSLHSCLQSLSCK